ncbi:MAG: AAA family ATPase [Desulfobacterales bacterium]|nr:AAA family ATPase [Desulfobacterales bacterium]
MKIYCENIPDPKELEKEISEFLSKKFGENVKVVSPIVMPREVAEEGTKKSTGEKKKINFNLKPEELISFLDQYIIKQDEAKAILATKICTHFNRIKRAQAHPDQMGELVGSIKNNILMIGPTGVGKTYMIKLIAQKIGVPFIKGDATKFSETGYVGGDVEDLVRDLVREADGDIEIAQCGIVYIDEIDKIASGHNMIGLDVSRTGVQRALLKPMEETDVDLKIPHDPVSMIQEIELFRKTGKRDRKIISTKNILFIMSGAFNGLESIIKKRLFEQSIGFGATIGKSKDQAGILRHVKSEDIIEFGFESEFVGRLPVRAVFDKLTEEDLYQILHNPNSPIILSKKLDFAAYDICVKFEDKLLQILAKRAFEENTGARGLVSAAEKALLLFEKKLPSTNVKKFPATAQIIENPENSLEELITSLETQTTEKAFERLSIEERESIRGYLLSNKKNLAEKHHLPLTPKRMDIIATAYVNNIMDIDHVFKKIKHYYHEIKKTELYFLKEHDVNIVFEEDAIDFTIEQTVNSLIQIKDLYKQLSENFELGLKLVREKTGQNLFFLTREALSDPESFISTFLTTTIRTK